MTTGQKIFIGLVIGAIILGLFFMFRAPREKFVRPATHTDRGDTQYASGNVRAAISEYKHSSNPEAKITQALIIANDLGDFDRAETILERVAENFPEYIPDIEEIVDTFQEERERQLIQDTHFDPDDLDIHFQAMLIETLHPPTTETEIRDDPQNVHDHFVQNDFRTNLEILKTETNSKFDPTAITDFEKYIDDDPAAKKVFQHIHDLSKNNLGDNPLELCQRVLEMAKTPEDLEKIRHELKLELRSAYGPGGIVCLTGIKTRIMGSLETVDDRFKMRPEWAMREEISSKVAQYRENILASYTDSERTLYNSGNEVMEQRVRDAAKKMFDTEYSSLSENDRERFSDLFAAL